MRVFEPPLVLWIRLDKTKHKMVNYRYKVVKINEQKKNVFLYSDILILSTLTRAATADRSKATTQKNSIVPNKPARI